MAFTKEEIELIKQAKAQGKSKEQALASLAQVRATTTAPTSQEDGGAISDIKAGFSGAKEALNRGVDREIAQGQEGRGFVSRQFGRFTSGLQTAGEMLGSIGEGAVRALPGGTTAIDTTEKVVGAGAQAVAESSIGQGAKQAFNMLPEQVQNTLTDVGRGALGAAGIAGTFAPTAAVTRPIISKIDDVIKTGIKTPEFKLPTARAGEIINKYRTQLSDVDPRVETILKTQKSPDKVMAYFDQAEKAAANVDAPMASQLAAQKAVDAYNAIDKGAKEAGKLKSELLKEIETVKIGGNIPGKAIDKVKSDIGERFGVEIDNDGAVRQVAGRMASIDDKSMKLVQNYVGMLRQLGQAPTARKLDDFVDAAQRMLYKQDAPMSKFEVADEPVVALLKQITGEVNGQMKTQIDDTLRVAGKNPDYSVLNEKYAMLNDVNNRLNSKLGQEGDKGASLMKSLFSPQTGEPTRRLFQEIKDQTGIDLFEEATLAKFAMESVGDPRSKSLLQQIDELAKESNLNLLEPGSWLQFIREKADLDGRDLAEAIIKQQSNAASTR
jgi:hypothetical protein